MGTLIKTDQPCPFPSSIWKWIMISQQKWLTDTKFPSTLRTGSSIKENQISSCLSFPMKFLIRYMSMNTSLPSHTHHQRLNLVSVACTYIVHELLDCWQLPSHPPKKKNIRIPITVCQETSHTSVPFRHHSSKNAWNTTWNKVCRIIIGKQWHSKLKCPAKTNAVTEWEAMPTPNEF